MTSSGKSPRRQSQRKGVTTRGNKGPRVQKPKTGTLPVERRSKEKKPAGPAQVTCCTIADSSGTEPIGTGNQNASVLIIEDADPVRLLLREVLRKAGFRVVEARNGREGLELYQREPTDVVITDLVMPEVGGQEVILELAWNTPPPKMIAITAESGDPTFLQVAEQFGAWRTLMKPLSRKVVVQAVQEALQEKRKYPRFEVNVPVSFAGDGMTGNGHLVDLSIGGCAVESEMPVKSGQYLTLQLNLPDRKSPVGVELAPVRWSRGQAFGLEFIRMKAEAQAVVRDYLQSLCGWSTPAVQPSY